MGAFHAVSRQREWESHEVCAMLLRTDLTFKSGIVLKVDTRSNAYESRIGKYGNSLLAKYCTAAGHILALPYFEYPRIETIGTNMATPRSDRLLRYIPNYRLNFNVVSAKMGIGQKTRHAGLTRHFSTAVPKSFRMPLLTFLHAHNKLRSVNMGQDAYLVDMVRILADGSDLYVQHQSQTTSIVMLRFAASHEERGFICQPCQSKLNASRESIRLQIIGKS